MTLLFNPNYAESDINEKDVESSYQDESKDVNLPLRPTPFLFKVIVSEVNHIISLCTR